MSQIEELKDKAISLANRKGAVSAPSLALGFFGNFQKHSVAAAQRAINALISEGCLVETASIDNTKRYVLR